jgi:radical SAM superfamily enzyme YgiQ (UPF0313 family)
MHNNTLISLQRTNIIANRGKERQKILLLKPPYFTPWTPPLGITILKSYLEQHNYYVKCFDFNTDPELWGMHHKYFAALQTLENVSINDGYSKLWWILNAHELAYANGANAAVCLRVLESIIPLYGIKYDHNTINTLIPLVDRFFQRLGNLIDQLDLSDFSIIGTSTYTTSLAASLFILKRVKEKYPRIRTVMGGGIFADDLALGSDNLNTLIQEYDFVDHVILGEGEILLLKLIEGELANKRVISIADIKGTTLDMKEVPIPDFSDLNLENYYHLTIEGARSCPFQCSFCSETVQWGDYRKKPMDQFADQVIGLAKKYKNNSFFMGDSLMNPYIFQFSSALLERKADVLYDGYLRADKPVTYGDKVRLWARSGFYRARLGIESASARVLDAMDKMTSPKIISDALQTLAHAGIRTTTYWIVGFPGETEDDFQETCEFIKQHHRYIYELEAHPYYYYPYGQIGSRLYQCYSLYLDEITDIIKFRVWEIIDCNPTREQRYDRLRRISKLAADLGLPNIYSMPERYQAEDRWHLLHPLAREVYEQTQVHRDEPPSIKQPVDLFSEQWRYYPEQAPPVEESVLCYHVSLKKRLDVATLSAAAENLIRFNQMLQVRLEGGRYIQTPEHGAEAGTIVSIFSRAEVPGDKEPASEGKIAESLAGGMRPERGASIRIAVINGEDQTCDLLLLVHRAVADSRSAALLFEDLFRIYEQLENGSPISLRPVQKTYSTFINELTSSASSIEGVPYGEALKLADHDSSDSVSKRAEKTEGEKAGALTIEIDKSLSQRMLSGALTAYGLTLEQAFSIAFLRTQSNAQDAIDRRVYMSSDYRRVDDALQYTVGALTQTIQLPEELKSESANHSRTRQVRDALKELAEANPLQGPPLSLSNAEGGVLLNFDYLIEQPWLGGYEWFPKGFIINQEEPRKGYILELAPILLPDHIEVRLSYTHSRAVIKLVESIKSSLVAELESVVAHCESYLSAKQFWLAEFDADAPASNLDKESDPPSVNDQMWVTTLCDIRQSAIDGMSAQYGVDIATAMLAAFSLLLSRLNGREDIVIVSAMMAEDETIVTPVRLTPNWKLSFRDFVRDTQQKLSLSNKHAMHAFDLLSRELSKSKPDWRGPMFDVALVHGNSVRAGSSRYQIERAMQDYPVENRPIDLTLELVGSGATEAVRFVYEAKRLSRATVNRLGVCLGEIIESVCKDVDFSLGEVRLGGDSVSYDESENMAHDAFNF